VKILMAGQGAVADWPTTPRSIRSAAAARRPLDALRTVVPRRSMRSRYHTRMVAALDLVRSGALLAAVERLTGPLE